MAEKNNMAQGGTCECGHGACCSCSSGHYHGFGWGLLRVIIGLIVLGLVFSFGIMVGQFKAYVNGFGGGHGFRMMRSYDAYPGYQVMTGGGYAVPPTETTSTKK